MLSGFTPLFPFQVPTSTLLEIVTEGEQFVRGSNGESSEVEVREEMDIEVSKEVDVEVAKEADVEVAGEVDIEAEQFEGILNQIQSKLR